MNKGADIEKKELTKFLLDESRTILKIETDKAYEKVFIKIELMNNIYALHKLTEFNYVSEGSCYMGVFDARDRVIYDANLLLEINEPIHIVNESLTSLSEKLQYEVEQHIQKMIFPDWRKWINQTDKRINEEITTRLNNEVIRTFFDDLTLNFSECTIEDLKKLNEGYSFFSSNRRPLLNTQSVFRWLSDKEKTVDMIATDYLAGEDAYETISQCLLIAKRKYDALKKIYENSDHKYDSLYLRKRMYTALKDIRVRDVAVIVKHENGEHEFKYNREKLIEAIISGTVHLKSYRDDYNDVIIQNRLTEIGADMIKEISFGNRVLYKNKSMSNELKRHNLFERGI